MDKFAKTSAILLTGLMLIKKLLSIVYKIPYQNITGDAGFYVFQQVYPFIAVLMMLTGFALPTVIGGMLTENHYSSAIKDRLKRLMWIFSLIVFVVLFLGHQQLARIMGDILLAPVIRIVGVHFLFLSPIAYLRGVLQSRPETIKKIGYSVVVEQMTRVLAILLVLYLFDPSLHNAYEMAGFAFGFSLISPVITLMHLYLLKPIDDVQSFLPLKGKVRFFQRTMYLVLGSGILILFSLIDIFLVFNVLVMTETLTDAMTLRGVLERGLPLVQAGTFFVGSLVAVTMTNLEKAETDKQKKRYFSTGFYHLLGLAVPATVGLIGVMPLLNQVLFMDQAGNVTLQWMMLQIIFYAIVVLLTATLSKEDPKKEQEPFVLVSLLVGILAKLVITVPMVQHFGITGASLSSVIGLFLTCVILLIGAKHLFTPKLAVALIGIGFSTFLMWVFLRQIQPLLVNLNTGIRTDYFTLLLINGVVGLLVYAIVLGGLNFIFKTLGTLVLLRHKKRQEQIKRINRAKARRREEALRRQEEARQEVLRQQQEALDRERYLRTLMHDKPPIKQTVSVDDQMLARGHQVHKQPEKYVPPAATNQVNAVVETTEKQTKKEGKNMRLDKFLKVSRIIKRRQTAKEVSDAGKISVNGKVAKSSTALHIGDEIALHYATRTLTIRVMEIKDSTKKEDAQRMYEVVREEPRI